MTPPTTTPCGLASAFQLRQLNWPPSLGPPLARATLQLFVGHLLGVDRPLHEPPEARPGTPVVAVEAPRELVQVEVEVLSRGGALVGPVEPALEQRGNPVDVRKTAVSWDSGALQVEAPMIEAFQRLDAGVRVGVHD